VEHIAAIFATREEGSRIYLPNASNRLRNYNAPYLYATRPKFKFKYLRNKHVGLVIRHGLSHSVPYLDSEDNIVQVNTCNLPAVPSTSMTNAVCRRYSRRRSFRLHREERYGSLCVMLSVSRGISSQSACSDQNLHYSLRVCMWTDLEN
jgi:hypothetical protein